MQLVFLLLLAFISFQIFKNVPKLCEGHIFNSEIAIKSFRNITFHDAF